MRALLAMALLVGGCRAAIEGDLSEAQANEVVVALDRHGIHAVKEARAGGGDEARYRVLVAPDDVATALAVLRADDLPRREEPGLHEIFGEGSLVPTATEERARLTAALAGELSRSIEAIDGVLDARVHVALPEGADLPLDAPRPRPRASVLIRHRGALPPYDDAQIRSLVAGAIDGMEPADVAIVGVEAAPADVEAAHLSDVLGIAVGRGSVPTLKLVLGALLGTNVVSLLLLALVAARSRRRAEPAAGEPAAAPKG